MDGETASGEPSPAAATEVAPGLERLLDAATVDQFVRLLLEERIRGCGAVHGAAWAWQDRSADSLRLLRESPLAVSSQTAEHWREPLVRQAREVLVEEAADVRRLDTSGGSSSGKRNYWSLGLPVPIGSDVRAALTIVVTGGKGGAEERARSAAELTASQAMLYGQARSARRLAGRYEEICRAWDLLAAAGAGYPDPDHMALGVVNKCREVLPVERVSLGWVRRGRVRLAAISEQDYVDRRSALSRSMVEAMQEAEEAGGPVVLPDTTDESEPAWEDFPACSRLADLSDDHALAAYPLPARDRTVGVLLAERREPRPFEPTQKRTLGIACQQLGPVLGLARRDARGLLRRAVDTVLNAVETATGEGHVAAKVAAGVIIALALLGAFGRTEMEISGNCRLEPARRRAVAAPFDGVLKEARVVPGDVLEPGELLCSFEDDELQLSLREARSRLIATQKQRDLHFSRQELSEYKIAEAKCDQLEAEIALLERRIRQADVRADFRGVVLKGDLRQEIGSPFRMGEFLLEIAPLEKLMLLTAVDQSDVDYVKEGQEGTFATRARPAEALKFTVERVRPMSEARQGKNVFTVEATVPNPDGWLRPGMEGAANIRAGEANLAWAHTRKLVGWLRMKLFF